MLRQEDISNSQRGLREQDAIIKSDGVSFTKLQVIYGYWDCKYIKDEMAKKGLTDAKYKNQLSKSANLKGVVFEENTYNDTITEDEVMQLFNDTKHLISESDVKLVDAVLKGTDTVEVKYKEVYDKNGGFGIVKEVGLLNSIKKKKKKIKK